MGFHVWRSSKTRREGGRSGLRTTKNPDGRESWWGVSEWRRKREEGEDGIVCWVMLGCGLGLGSGWREREGREEERIRVREEY